MKKINFPSPEKNYKIDITDAIKSLNRLICFLIFTCFFQSLYSEEQIDIWNKELKDKKNPTTIKKSIDESANSSIDINKPNLTDKIEIAEEITQNTRDKEIFGIYDPEKNNFNLNMWSETDADKVRSSFKRINKIQLSDTATKLLKTQFYLLRILLGVWNKVNLLV